MIKRLVVHAGDCLTFSAESLYIVFGFECKSYEISAEIHVPLGNNHFIIPYPFIRSSVEIYLFMDVESDPDP